MQIVTSLSEFPKLAGSALSAGTFDGVHRGHQHLLGQLQARAKAQGLPTVVLTFWPHPRLVVNSEAHLELLSTPDEKADALAAMGIDYLVRMPFSMEVASLSAEAYVQQVLVDALRAKQVVVGFDHHFGKGRQGDFALLRQLGSANGFEAHEVAEFGPDGSEISSSTVRQALRQGQPERAAHLLGRPYQLSGRVVEGAKLGRTLGFPTANLAPTETYKLIPARGAYAVQVGTRGQWHPAMLNIGVKPTVGQHQLSIEAHLLHHHQDLYGEVVQVQFLHFLREEIRFDSLAALKDQLEKDRKKAQELLTSGKR